MESQRRIGLGGLVRDRDEIAGDAATLVALPLQVRTQVLASNASDGFNGCAAISRNASLLPVGDVLVEDAQATSEFGRRTYGVGGEFKRSAGFGHAGSINMPLRLLSTTSFGLSNDRFSRDHKRMVDYPDVASRLDHILGACEYPSQTAFLDALNLKPQNWRNWRERDSFGRSDIKIHELTGADIGWLKTGKGTPFPNGPVLYSGADPVKLEQRIRELQDEAQLTSSMLSALAATITATTQGAGEDLLRRLKSVYPDPGLTPPGLAVVIRAVEAARRSTAPAGRPAAPPKSSGTPPRKGR